MERTIITGGSNKQMIETLIKQMFGEEYFVTENLSVLFRLEGKFLWGKYSTNQLRDVYKVDPSYVQWCIVKHEGFGIYEPDLVKMLQSKVFDQLELDRLDKIQKDNCLVIDLTKFQRDHNGFLVNPEMPEIVYSTNLDLLAINKEKCSRGGITLDNFQSGKSTNDSDIKLPFKGVGKIQLKVP